MSIAFVSSGGVSGTAGIAAFDTVCTDDATSAGLSGTFRALVAEGDAAPIMRVVGDGPWYRPDGVRIGARSELAANLLDAPIAVSADGLTYRNVPVWTGAEVPGVAGVDCDNWSGGTTGYVSSSGDTTVFTFQSRTCGAARNVYCFQSDE